MSLRLQLLQVARLAPRLLGESTDLVRQFLNRQWTPEGGACDRSGRPDLYYTIFALAGLDALQAEIPTAKLIPYLRSFGDGENLDFVHLGALARCWAAVGIEHAPPDLVPAILDRLERFRTGDGGYDVTVGAKHGTAYGAFVALGAYQDLGHTPRQPLSLLGSLRALETPDGAWSNVPGVPIGSTNATAGAVTLIHHLGFPVPTRTGDWLMARAHPQGGFVAAPGVPMPDLLSTATVLHALTAMERRLPSGVHERCLDFLDSVWTAEGGFHGHWADDDLDAEYTFYGILALGHLSL